jgi:hypothetical protein
MAPIRSGFGIGTRIGVGVLTILILFVASGAQAKSHLWRFTEAFSNANGNIQFIEMFVFDPAGTAETKFSGKSLTSDANTYIFPNDLPDENTFERWVLIATQDFADLPGAPVPDFILPANFFDPAGDEIRYRTTIDIFTIPSGQMPVDGIHSLLTDLSTPVNSPTNFAGVEGSVNAAAPVPGLQGWAIALTLFGLVALGLSSHRRLRPSTP